MSFMLAFFVFVGMHIPSRPQTRAQAALAITLVLGALAVMLGKLFVLIGWIDWSFWAAVISIWFWFMVILMISKPGESIPNPFRFGK